MKAWRLAIFNGIPHTVINRERGFLRRLERELVLRFLLTPRFDDRLGRAVALRQHSQRLVPLPQTQPAGMTFFPVAPSLIKFLALRLNSLRELVQKPAIVVQLMHRHPLGQSSAEPG